MNPTETKQPKPFKYAWPLPVFLLSILTLAILAKTIPTPDLFSYTFPLTLVLQFSVFAGLALSLKFFGKQRKNIPKWIFVCNAILGFAVLPLLFVIACISWIKDH